MRRRSSSVHVLAAVATTVVVTPAQAQRLATGSTVPCAVPMSWTIARIDPRFDLSEEWAIQAARDAGALWQRAVGAELFRFGDDDGHRVFFDYDERQASVEAHRERERVLETERMSIERRRIELDEASREYDSMLERYERDVVEHGWAVQAYNNDLRRWVGRDDVPRRVEAELERRRDELDESAQDLRNRERELNRRSDAIRDDVERFNERIEELGRGQASLARDFPVSSAESGTYDETVRWDDAEPVSVTRRIRVFRFPSYDDLVLVLAHELGHALGLGHAPEDGAVMSEVIVSAADVIPSGSVTPVDVRMLSARCPDLGR